MKMLIGMFLLFTTSFAIAGESPMNAPGYFTCRSLGSGKTVYFSAVFAGKGTDKPTDAFSQMLRTKYGFTDGGSCGMAYKAAGIDQKLVSDQASYAEQLRKQGIIVVETGWTFNGVPAITATNGGNSTAAKPAISAKAAAIDGVYNGTYTCAKGPRTLRLSLNMGDTGLLNGVFTFYIPPTSHAQGYSYSLNGRFDPDSGKFNLVPLKWDGPAPDNYVMVGMEGVFNPSAKRVTGKITYSGCNAFEATR
jgi:hypothetical protein